MKISCPTCRIFLLEHKDKWGKDGRNKDTYFCEKCGLYHNITCMYGQESWAKEFVKQK